MSKRISVRPLLAASTLLLALSARALQLQNPTFNIPERPQALAFLHRLQAAFRAQNRKQVATMIHYPLQALEDGNPHMIETPVEFLRDYDRIFTPAKIQAILQTRDSEVEYRAGDGYMTPWSVIWFDNAPQPHHANRSFGVNTVNEAHTEAK